MRRAGTLLIAAALAASPAAARDALGIFERWGAFRDGAVPRCFAIAEPARRSPGARWRPFVAVSHWPARAVRGQIHVRLRAAKRRGRPVTLAIGDRRFALIAGGADAWAADARGDAAIVAAMRSGTSMSIAFTDSRGRTLVDAYPLRGAATAIDAAALGCARRTG